MSMKEHVSLYMPTHRTHPDNLQDPILLKPAKKPETIPLLQKHSESEVTTLEPFVALESDEEFWRNTSDGLAVLGTIDMFKTISLPVAIEELTVVSNSFHTKPLRRYLQSVERYNVLGLSYMIIKFTKETDIRS
jgi:FlaA1/EpsC-like NDP-sugar epimerase